MRSKICFIFFDKSITQTLYFQLNPEHTVPTLIDGDFVIWDSHAICTYLVDKYAKDDKLYPRDLQLRAKCNQRLFFDGASLFFRLREVNIPIYLKGATGAAKEQLELIRSTYDILEAFLATDPFLVGNDLTVADITAATSILALEIHLPVQLETHPNISAWLKRVNETIPVFKEINVKGTEMLRKILTDCIERNKLKL